MRIVIPLASQNDYTELFYCLRSIDKFFKKPYEIIIVGDMVPTWITNVTQIKLPDIPGRAVLSVRRKVLAALEYAQEDIFFMNDDFYLLQDTTGRDFPYYSSGTLKGKGESGAAQLFKQLETYNKPYRYFGHYPCIYHKDFENVLENFSSDCLTKSAYCNFVDVKSIEVSDCKLMYKKLPEFIHAFIKGRPSFSTGMNSISAALPVLEELFSEPSQFEV